MATMTDFELESFFNENVMKQAVNSENEKKFWRPTKDSTDIRILPPMPNERLFYCNHSVHWYNKLPYECINQTKVDSSSKEHVAEECPICKLASQIYKVNPDRDSSTYKLASKFSGKQRAIVRVIVRGEKDEGTVYFYELPVSVYNAIILAMSPENSKKYGSIVGPLDGRDITISKTGKGQEVKYSAQIAPNTSPIFESREKTIAVLKQAMTKPYNALFNFKSKEEFNQIAKEILTEFKQLTAPTQARQPVVQQPTPVAQPVKTVSTPVAPRDAMEDLMLGADESASIESEDDSGLDSLLSEFGLN